MLIKRRTKRTAALGVILAIVAMALIGPAAAFGFNPQPDPPGIPAPNQAQMDYLYPTDAFGPIAAGAALNPQRLLKSR